MFCFKMSYWVKAKIILLSLEINSAAIYWCTIIKDFQYRQDQETCEASRRVVLFQVVIMLFVDPESQNIT